MSRNCRSHGGINLRCYVLKKSHRTQGTLLAPSQHHRPGLGTQVSHTLPWKPSPGTYFSPPGKCAAPPPSHHRAGSARVVQLALSILMPARFPGRRGQSHQAEVFVHTLPVETKEHHHPSP